MRRRFSLLCIGIVAVSLGLASAQAASWIDSLPLVFDDGEGHTMPYRLFLPSGYDAPDASLPLVLFLHGAGERGNDNYQQVSVSYIEGVINATQGDQFSAFLVAPQVPSGGSWSSSLQRDLALQITETLINTYSVDYRRLYITGYSMGGFGTFNYVTYRPDLFAAAVPIAGGGDPSQADLIKDIPIWVFHGADDTVVPVTCSREMVAAIEAAGGTPLYTEIPGAGHGIGGSIYQDADSLLYPWMFEQVQNRFRYWDEHGDAAWDDISSGGNSHWVDEAGLPIADYPDATFDAVVRSNMVGVVQEHGARALEIQNGGIAIGPEGILTVVREANLGAGTTLDVAGTFAARYLHTAATHVIAEGATLSVSNELTVDSILDVAGATLSTSPGVTRINVNHGGSLTVGHPLVGAELNVSGTVQTAGTSVTDLKLSSGGVLSTSGDLTTGNLECEGGTLNASADVTTTNLNFADGALYLSQNANLNVATMEVSGGIVNTGSGYVVVSDNLQILGTSLSIADGTFKANSMNLADVAEPDTFTLTGGTLSVARPVQESKRVLVVSDEAPGGKDDSLVELIESLGHTADTSGMAGAYRTSEAPFNDPAKLAVLESVDLVLVSRATSAFGYAESRNEWNELEMPLLLMNGDLTRGGPRASQHRWGWTTSRPTDASSSEDEMIVWAGQQDHPFVAGLSSPVQIFDWTSAPEGEAPASVRIPYVNTASEGTTVVGMFDGSPYLIDIPAGFDFDQGGEYRYGRTGQRRIFMGHWGYHYVDYDFEDFVTDEFRTLLANVLDIPVLGPLVFPNRNIVVTGDSTLLPLLPPSIQEAVFGDLAIDSHVTLSLAGAPSVSFDDVSAGDDSSIEGIVSVRGSLSPDSNIGILNVDGELRMDETATYIWELGTLASDSVAVVGDLSLGDNWTLLLTDAGGICNASDQFDLFTYTGSLTFGGYTIDGRQVDRSGRWDYSNATINYDDHRVYLSGLQVIPEPGTAMMLVTIGIILLTYNQRRQKTV